MSEEGDSWFKAAFGVDLGQAASKLTEVAGDVIAEAKGIEAQVGGAVQGAFNQVTGAAAGLVQKAAGGAPAAPRAASGGAVGGGTGSFPLGGSVGRGGKNAASDVRAVQGALGIAADGRCGQQTIAAIEAFQRNIGQARPDGRVDAGGATERALAGGARPAAASGAPPATPGSDDSGGGLAGRIGAEAGALLQGAESAVQSSLQSAQDSVFEGLGVAPETAEGIKAAEQAIADFDRGRQAGRASGSAGLIEMLPPVQLAKAGARIAEADDGEAEALKIADEKRATLAAIGKFGIDPAGSGAAIGENLGKSAVKARQEGRMAEFVGNLVGQGDVVAATVAVGGAGAGLEAGGAEGAAAGVEAGGARGLGAGVEAGGARGLGAGVDAGGARGLGAGVESGGARGVATGAEEGGIVVRTTEGADAAAPTSRAPAFGDPVPPEAQVKGPPTEVDPVSPPPEPAAPKPNVAQTPEQARQNLIDAVAKQKAAEQASREATEEFVRFRANKPNPARGFEGDPSKFDPVVSEALEDQMLRAQQANDQAIRELKAAQQAARDAAGRAKGARGGGGFPPPR
jgi:hypothetical protein